MEKTSLTYDIVIVTRNRTDALELSIPLMLAHETPPQNFIVIDSSDDHEPIAKIVRDKTKNYTGNVIIEHTTPGISRQRNLGLDKVTSDIVFYPDDDSLYYPNTIAAVMSVYERDKEQAIVGVCTKEASDAPPSVDLGQSYDLTLTDKFKKKISAVRFKLERLLLKDPFLTLGKRLYKAKTLPGWLEDENCIPVEYMTGFRMTFRTSALRKVKFNENLTRYSLFEDTDTSLMISSLGLLVGALNTQIYHHKYPGNRGNGRTLGFIQLFNRAYILTRNSPKPVTGFLWLQLQLFSLYKIAQYLITSVRVFQRERFIGALKAYVKMQKLIRLPKEKLDEYYSATLQAVTKGL